MARDTYGEFLAYAAEAASQKFMESRDLSVASCGDKMRLLTLVSLAHAHKEVHLEHTTILNMAMLCHCVILRL